MPETVCSCRRSRSVHRSVLFFFFKCVPMWCTHIYGMDTCMHGTPVEMRQLIWESSLLPSCGSRDGSQATELTPKCPYWVSHVTWPCTFFKDLFHFVCIQMCTWVYTCVSHVVGTWEGHAGSLGTGVPGNWEIPSVGAELNLGPLQEQPVLQLLSYLSSPWPVFVLLIY